MSKSKRNKEDIQREKVRAILERDFSYSLMNDTKWMEAFDVLHTLRVRVRTKRVDNPEPDRWTLPSGGTHSWLPKPYVDESHPFRVMNIEWLEIEPFERTEIDGAEMQADRTAALEEQLQAVNIPYTWHEGVVRIVGHQRKS